MTAEGRNIIKVMETPKEPHSISLKVLRLSQPFLAQQFPLPSQQSTLQIRGKSNSNALSSGPGNEFILDPLLLLPSTFGSAYVGETFACSLCANNELEQVSDRVVASVKMEAEMQTPSAKFPLELIPETNDQESTIQPGQSLQKTVRYDLREEGNHVLAVSLSYNENKISKDKSVSSNRVRTFRKLYQFSAQPCLGVRTKITPLSRAVGEKQHPSDFAVEAQLQNLADGSLSLEKVSFSPKTESAFRVRTLDWENAEDGLDGPRESPYLNPRDVWQVAFLVHGLQGSAPETTKDGRIILGQLSLQWRTGMGNKGYLSTGWLLTKKA